MQITTSSVTGSAEQRARSIGKETGSGDGPGPEVMAADTLCGDSVVNSRGEKLGTIGHIILDVRHGRVAYAVLSVGGLLGIGDRLFAIPWDALALDIDRKCFVLCADEERLKNAPGFDKDHWPSMADSTWASDVHRYFGLRPYWEYPEDL